MCFLVANTFFPSFSFSKGTDARMNVVNMFFAIAKRDDTPDRCYFEIVMTYLVLLVSIKENRRMNKSWQSTFTNYFSKRVLVPILSCENEISFMTWDLVCSVSLLTPPPSNPFYVPLPRPWPLGLACWFFSKQKFKSGCQRHSWVEIAKYS